eukprot:scpid29695/ scgid28084/ Uncharacterized protein C19orf44
MPKFKSLLDGSDDEDDQAALAAYLRGSSSPTPATNGKPSAAVSASSGARFGMQGSFSRGSRALGPGLQRGPGGSFNIHGSTQLQTKREQATSADTEPPSRASTHRSAAGSSRLAASRLLAPSGTMHSSSLFQQERDQRASVAGRSSRKHGLVGQRASRYSAMQPNEPITMDPTGTADTGDLDLDSSMSMSDISDSSNSGLKPAVASRPKGSTRRPLPAGTANSLDIAALSLSAAGTNPLVGLSPLPLSSALSVTGMSMAGAGAMETRSPDSLEDSPESGGHMARFDARQTRVNPVRMTKEQASARQGHTRTQLLDSRDTASLALSLDDGDMFHDVGSSAASELELSITSSFHMASSGSGSGSEESPTSSASFAGHHMMNIDELELASSRAASRASGVSDGTLGLRKSVSSSSEFGSTLDLHEVSAKSSADTTRSARLVGQSPLSTGHLGDPLNIPTLSLPDSMQSRPQSVVQMQHAGDSTELTGSTGSTITTSSLSETNSQINNLLSVNDLSTISDLAIDDLSPTVAKAPPSVDTASSEEVTSTITESKSQDSPRSKSTRTIVESDADSRRDLLLALDDLVSSTDSPNELAEGSGVSGTSTAQSSEKLPVGDEYSEDCVYTDEFETDSDDASSSDQAGSAGSGETGSARSHVSSPDSVVTPRQSDCSLGTGSASSIPESDAQNASDSESENVPSSQTLTHQESDSSASADSDITVGTSHIDTAESGTTESDTAESDATAKYDYSDDSFCRTAGSDVMTDDAEGTMNDRRRTHQADAVASAAAPRPAAAVKGVVCADKEVQTSSADIPLIWQAFPCAVASATPLGMATVDSRPLAEHVVSAESLEAVTAYSPVALAITDMLRQQITSTKRYMEAARLRYHSLTCTQAAGKPCQCKDVPNQARLPSNGGCDLDSGIPRRQFRYTTLRETRDYIHRHRPKH